jgi:hypothetical protein
MPRIRTIKPEFPQSESMGRVSREARLLFILLWTICDDSGRTRAASRMLASLLYPYDDDAPKRIDGWLGELEREECVIRYQAEGATYLQVCNWLNHQKIDKPSASKIPAFDESSRIIANPREHSSGDLRIKDQGSRTKEGTKDQPVGQEPDRVAVVFDHWKSAHGHPSAKLDQRRRKVISTALESYGPDELCEAVSGYLNSPHHMGQNDRSTKYDDIELFLRDAKHIDAGLKFSRERPTTLSKLTRANIERTAEWVPPEIRNAGQ